MNPMMTQGIDQDKVRDQFELWFFRDLNGTQRNQLFTLIFGRGAEEITSDFWARQVLRRVIGDVAACNAVKSKISQVTEKPETMSEEELAERVADLVRNFFREQRQTGGGHDTKYKFEDGHYVNRVSGEPIPEDEPIMIFRARDRHALHTLYDYAERIKDPEHQKAIEQQINLFAAFSREHPERMKEPTTNVPDSAKQT